MQLAIPHAPRAVRLSQLPGARARVAVVAVAGLSLWGAAVIALRPWWVRASARTEFVRRAAVVEGVVASARPVVGTDESRVDVLYAVEGRRFSATALPAATEAINGLGPAAQVKLLIDPAAPEHAAIPSFAEEDAAAAARARLAVLVLVALALALVAAAAAATARDELRRFRLGALVWLTPEAEVDGRRFVASFQRGEERVRVRATRRGVGSPVKNGDKVLAAVAPRGRTARVVDEDLARRLGWLS